MSVGPHALRSVGLLRPALVGLARRRPVQHALGIAAVAALLVAGFAAVRATGGSPNPLNHLGYLPIVLAAYLYGWRGGLLTGITVAFVLGPLATLLALPGGLESAESWAARAVFYVAIGGLVGVLFEQTRARLNGWRSAAVTIARREREAMIALARGAEAKDTDTGDHIARVRSTSAQLALAVGFPSAHAEDIGWSAMLHDVGKLHVPDALLLKPGPLSASEWQIMRQHPLWGEQILEHGDGFELARQIARWHHENVDGSGYPDGLRGDRIPLEARIVRVSDAFDAMTHRRPYHEARSVEWAIEELDRFAGSVFDPELVRLFVDLVRAERLQAVELGRHQPAQPAATRRERQSDVDARQRSLAQR